MGASPVSPVGWPTRRAGRTGFSRFHQPRQRRLGPGWRDVASGGLPRPPGAVMSNRGALPRAADWGPPRDGQVLKRMLGSICQRPVTRANGRRRCAQASGCDARAALRAGFLIDIPIDRLWVGSIWRERQFCQN